MLASLLSWISGGLLTSVLQPVFAWLGKRQDVTLEGFKAAAGEDATAYTAWLDFEKTVYTARLAAASWWGPKLLCMLVGVPACLHVGMIFLDSTFTFGMGHYGSLGIAKLPPDYFDCEKIVVDFVFGVSIVGPMASSVSSWLHRA
ncbi:hypothetical protein [Lichenihabitans psoromatis]|uniref:hypothetical protein n=1 Tax=Lichenihabitans psoromatis TaxID=2528642 RepID=UPI0010361074|nr:hypothetical protein [Lichenihabitans psoromatis]